MDIESTLKKYIYDEILVGSSDPLGNDDSLIDSGIIDSLSLLRLMSFIEKQFNIQIDDQEVVGDNFQTINVMKSFIEGKL
jgi:acyl carrier protein